MNIKTRQYNTVFKRSIQVAGNHELGFPAKIFGRISQTFSRNFAKINEAKTKQNCEMRKFRENHVCYNCNN